MNVPGFEQALREAMQEAEAGEVVSFDSIRRTGKISVILAIAYLILVKLLDYHDMKPTPII